MQCVTNTIHVMKYVFLLLYIAGSDFVTVDEGLVFNTGDTSMCIDVTILGDLVVEDAESFFLTLTSSDADIGQSNAIIFINDDDQPGQLFTTFQLQCIHAWYTAIS